MHAVLGLIFSLPESKWNKDDDFADRMSCRYSVIVLVMFAITISMNEIVREPITCWAPVHFAGSHESYANSYCWVRNTYYLPWHEEIPRPHEERQTIPYYQWMSIILLVQALLFYLPTVVWHGFNSKAGIDADNILDAAQKVRKAEDEDERKRMLKLITNQLDRFLATRAKDYKFEFDLKHLLSATLCRCCGRRVGNYLVMLFLFSKICFIANAIGQLFLLNKILAMQFHVYGFEVLKYMVADHDWTEARTVAFPRVTMCDFAVRRLGNNHRYTVQCVLPINLYNEKIYMFLWFWLVSVAVVSIASFVVWLARVFSGNDRVTFIDNRLQQGKQIQRINEPVRVFVYNYLGQDGSFLLRLIAHNTDSITTTDVVCSLWNKWKTTHLSKNNDETSGSIELEKMVPKPDKYD